LAPSGILTADHGLCDGCDPASIWNVNRANLLVGGIKAGGSADEKFSNGVRRNVLSKVLSGVTMARRSRQADLISALVSSHGDEFRFALIRGILEASPDGILVVDNHDRIVTHNRRMLQVWDIQDAELPGAHDGSAEGLDDHHLLARVLSRVAHPEMFLARVKELYADPKADDHCEIDLKDGRTLERHSTGLWNRRDEYLGRVWFFRDITERKRTEVALTNLAQTDPLTGVANLRQFLSRANEEFVRAKRFDRPLSLVIVDIDHFKAINDQWGHAVGDEVLRTLCIAWSQIVRRVDLLARIGGEEFAWLLTETGQAKASLAAEKLRRVAAEASVHRHSDIIKFSISAGVSTMAPSDRSIEACVQRADAALYRAKANGRNRTESGV
jgi:diguanylate cyclase (GGDEF)-like protein